MVKTDLRGRHFLTLKDFSVEEIEEILDTATELKLKLVRGEEHELSRGKTLAMIFARPSTRTRVSFETGMTQLGGHAQFLSAGIGLHALRENLGPQIEPWKDVGRVVSRMVNGIMARVDHEALLELAKYSRVPIINGCSDYGHPCQAMADFLTIREKKLKFQGKKMVFAWTNSAQYLKAPTLIYDEINAGVRLGMDVVVSCPEGFEPKEDIKAAEEFSSVSGGSVKVSRNLKEAVEDADIIHAKSWRLPEHKIEDLPNVKAPEKYKEWHVTEDLVNQAKKDVIVMNAMPFIRDDELHNDVAEGPHSVLFDEAENRLHAQKGVLALLL